MPAIDAKYFDWIKKVLSSRTIFNQSGGCWEYQGTNADGYGQISILGGFHYTHRLSAVIHLGYSEDSDLHVLHSCNNRCCWNPEHLRVGTNLENIQDKMIAGNGANQNTYAEFCIHGHKFTVANTYWVRRGKNNPNLRRQCRTCRRERDIDSRPFRKMRG